MKSERLVPLKRPVGWLAGGALALWILAGICPASDVPFVPTPQETVIEMLTLAGVGEGDLLYDLGSGDGRIVITAAEMGASAVGIDIDPERIREGSQNAEAAGVSDRVVFYQQDLFEAYIGDATVVTLYLLPSVNLRLRPKLLEELRPGTRVVSYSFDMETWEPDLELGDGRGVYLWIVPANLTGTWRWSGGDGTRHEMTVNQEFQKITGSISSGQTVEPILDATLEGDLVKFFVERNRNGGRELVIYEGRVEGEVIEGIEESTDGRVPWKADRDPGTETILDNGAGIGFTRLYVPSSSR